MKWKELSHSRSNLFKAMAILMIVIHNFMHWLPSPKEMEFQFTDGFFLHYLNSIFNEPLRFIQHSFSYFGHFGVQIFIFLSAYGLTKSFLKNEPSYLVFLAKRVWLIYPTFILAIIFWAISYNGFSYGLLTPFKTILWMYEPILYKLTLSSNFVEGQVFKLVGPWWFISFIFQCYLLFPFLFKLSQKYGGLSLVVLTCVSLLLVIISSGKILNQNLMYTALGHLPELCLGIFLAQNDKKSIDCSSLFLSGVAFLFILGNMFEIFWYFNHLTALILLLVIFNYLSAKLENLRLSKSVLSFIGVISMHLFLVNGFLRQPFIGYVLEENTWLSAIVYCFVSLLCSVIVAYVLRGFDSGVRKLLKYVAKPVLNRNI